MDNINLDWIKSRDPKLTSVIKYLVYRLCYNGSVWLFSFFFLSPTIFLFLLEDDQFHHRLYI